MNCLTDESLKGEGAVTSTCVPGPGRDHRAAQHRLPHLGGERQQDGGARARVQAEDATPTGLGHLCGNIFLQLNSRCDGSISEQQVGRPLQPPVGFDENPQR